jgi:hypothetical protein
MLTRGAAPCQIQGQAQRENELGSPGLEPVEKRTAAFTAFFFFGQMIITVSVAS